MDLDLKRRGGQSHGRRGNGTGDQAGTHALPADGKVWESSLGEVRYLHAEQDFEELDDHSTVCPRYIKKLGQTGKGDFVMHIKDYTVEDNGNTILLGNVYGTPKPVKAVVKRTVAKSYLPEILQCDPGRKWRFSAVSAGLRTDPDIGVWDARPVRKNDVPLFTSVTNLVDQARHYMQELFHGVRPLSSVTSDGVLLIWPLLSNVLRGVCFYSGVPLVSGPRLFIGRGITDDHGILRRLISYEAEHRPIPRWDSNLLGTSCRIAISNRSRDLMNKLWILEAHDGRMADNPVFKSYVQQGYEQNLELIDQLMSEREGMVVWPDPKLIRGLYERTPSKPIQIRDIRLWKNTK